MEQRSDAHRPGFRSSHLPADLRAPARRNRERRVPGGHATAVDAGPGDGARRVATHGTGGLRAAARRRLRRRSRRLGHDRGGRVDAAATPAEPIHGAATASVSAPGVLRAAACRRGAEFPRNSVRPVLRYDFRYPLPAVDDLPWLQWRRLTARCLRRASIGFLSYGPPQGYEPLRRAIADYLRPRRGVTCDPAHIVVVGGSQQALDLIARVLVDPDDRLAIEDPHYPAARQVFTAAGARLVPIPVDGDGLDPNELWARAGGARLVYVTPSHQFPTGAVLPLERRLTLLDWAERARAFVI